MTAVTARDDALPRYSVPWTQQLFDAVPWAPVWVGSALAAVLVALFLAVEFALGRFEALSALAVVDPEDAFRDFRLAIFNCLQLVYLPTAFAYVVHSARRSASALRPLVGTGDAETERLLRGAGSYERAPLRAFGLIGLASSYAVAMLATRGSNQFDLALWSPEVVWHRITTPLIGWFLLRLFYAVLAESGRLSRVAARMETVDLWDLRPLAPFTRVGLTHALLAIGFFSLFALFLSEEGFVFMVGFIGLMMTGLALSGLLLPVRGVRQRIRAAKQAEFDWCNAALRAARTELSQEGPSTENRMADILAYKGAVEAVREWPFDASTFRRLGLYAVIPVASWTGGALMERAFDALLD